MVLRDLDRFVVKPTNASGGYGVIIGPKATYRELIEARRAIEREPNHFIAQPVVQLSVHPTLVGDSNGAVPCAPRHVDLRPFVLLGKKTRVLPGGLTASRSAKGR